MSAGVPGTITVQPARPDDGPAIGAIMAGHRLWSQVDGDRWASHVSAMLAGPDHVGYVAVHGDRRVGFVILVDHTFADSGYVRLIGVAAHATGLGIGHALLSRAEEHFRALGRRALFLLCTDWNVDAQRFYERHGFAAVGALPDWVARGVNERIYVKPFRDGTA